MASPPCADSRPPIRLGSGCGVTRWEATLPCDGWGSISANSYLADLSGPIQLHHGTADTSVPVEFSEILYDQIILAGGQAELYIYEGADHNLSGPFTPAMQRTIEFFNRYLKGE